MSNFKVELSELEAEDKVGTTIMVENDTGQYLISSDVGIENIYDLKETILVPILLAMGYSSELVDELFDGEEETSSPVKGVGSKFFHSNVIGGYTIDSTYSGGNIVALYDRTGEMYSSNPIQVVNRYDITDWEWDKITVGNSNFFTQLIS